jgi:hypothetical protein
VGTRSGTDPKALLEKVFDPSKGWTWTQNGLDLMGILISEGQNIKGHGREFDANFQYLDGTVTITERRPLTAAQVLLFQMIGKKIVRV